MEYMNKYIHICSYIYICAYYGSAKQLPLIVENTAKQVNKRLSGQTGQVKPVNCRPEFDMIY